MIKILQKQAPVLREKALPVPIEEIKSAKIKKILSEMKKALDSQDDGVAIAAPQIGYPLRIFVISRKVEEIIAESRRNKVVKDQEQGNLMSEKQIKNLYRDLVFINPVIKKLSKEKKKMEEGCLSVRYLYGQVNRSTKATITAFDENAVKIERGGTGLMAQIYQHETDHLDGILFTDKAEDVIEMIPEKLKKNVKPRKTK